MADRRATVRIGTEGEQRVMRMLRGIVAQSRRSSRDMARDHARGEAEERRAEDRTVEHTRRAEETKRREARRTADEARRLHAGEVREAERSAQMQARARRSARGAGGPAGPIGPRARRARGGGGGGFGEDLAGSIGIPMSVGAVIGSFGAVADRFIQNLVRVTNAMESAAGVEDIGQRTVSAQDFQRNLERIGGEVFAGQDTAEYERNLAAVQNEINAIALATNQSPGQLLEALSGLQTEFSAFEFGRENLQAMAEEAQRTGSDIETIARFAGRLRQTFGEMETGRALDIAAQAGLQGALTPRELGEEFAGETGLFQTFVDPSRSATPEENFRTFTATANVLRQGAPNAAEAATDMRNMFTSLSHTRVQGNIEEASGVDINDFRDAQTGRLDIGGFVEALQGSGRFGNLETIIDAVGDQQASRALNTLIQARTQNLADPENHADIRELEAVSAESGENMRRRNLARVQATSAEQAVAVATATQVEGIQSLDRRADPALVAMATRERLQRQGPVGEVLASSDYLMSAVGAVADSSLGRAVLGSEMGRAAVGSAQMDVATGQGNAIEQVLAALGAVAEERSERNSALAGKESLGKELASELRSGGPIPVRPVGGAGSLGTAVDQGSRTPGGPARR